MTVAEPLQSVDPGVKAPIDAFYFNPEYLAQLADQYRAAWRNAAPCPHIVIDNFLPEWVLDRLNSEFPSAKEGGHDFYQSPNESRKGKSAITRVAQLGPFTRQLLGEFNASLFVEFLEDLTGIEHLVPDPHLLGGGTHETERGGFLKIHADFNWEPRLRLDRRLNLILYLNRDWKDEYGGHLEFWEKDMSRCTAKYAPIFNRAVLFYVADDSNHGHPEPLTCPDDRSRRSVALFYYSNGRPLREIAMPHTTRYKLRPGEAYQRRRVIDSARIMERFVPPIVSDVVAFARARMSSYKK